MPVRVKAQLFHRQCVGKCLALSYPVCMKETQTLGSLLCITYEGAQDSEALWYAMCMKYPQVLGSLLYNTYEGAHNRLFEPQCVRKSLSF